jgi:uracil-DNA glycosylase
MSLRDHGRGVTRVDERQTVFGNLRGEKGTHRALARYASTMSDNVIHAFARLRTEAAGCRRCPLWRDATQTVFGEGPVDAEMMLVGEQPGHEEDLAGRPFVGPAGRLLDRALAAAGIDRGTVYLTNAVKHFKHEPRGKRRLHKKPNAGEIEACRWWIDNERRLVRPRAVVALGSTAAGAVLGRPVVIGRVRGKEIAVDGGSVWITVHPSSLLRLPDRDSRHREFGRFVGDLILAREWVGRGLSSGQSSASGAATPPIGRRGPSPKGSAGEQGLA